jgi:hypothetical protein
MAVRWVKIGGIVEESRIGKAEDWMDDGIVLAERQRRRGALVRNCFRGVKE